MSDAMMLEVAITRGLNKFLDLVFGAVYRENSVLRMFGIATRKNSRDIRFAVMG
jgi:hypothetical protein